jgi:Domain of unknown function (DUF4232)
VKIRILVCAVALGVVASAVGAASSGAAVARCKTAGLVVWLDTQGDAAAGSIFYTLEFTNQSGHTCTLTGYPGVSAFDLRGRTLGSPASRTPSTVHTVTLANGGVARTALRIAQAANFPQASCRRVSAAGLRVFPPNTTASKVIPLPFQACSRTGPVYLDVKAVTR